MNTKTSKMTMSLKEILWRLLEQWRAVLLCMLIVMLAFLAYTYKANRRDAVLAWKDQKRTQNMTTEEIMQTLPEDQRPAVGSAYRMEQQKAKEGRYIAEAPLMQLDPYHVDVLQYWWTLDPSDQNIPGTIQAYTSAIDTDEHCQQLIDKSGLEMPVNRWRELMFFRNTISDTGSTYTWGVRLPEGVQADAVSEQMAVIVKEVQKKLEHDGQKTSLKQLSKTRKTTFDLEVLNLQTQNYTSFYTIQSQLTTLTGTLTPEQAGVLQRLKSRDRLSEQAEIPKPQPARPWTLRNILTGLVLGFVVYILLFFVYLYCVLLNRINDQEALKQAGVRSLGEWVDPASVRNRLFCDPRVFRKHHRGNCDEEETAQSMTETLLSTCKYKDIKKLLVTATTALSDKQQAYLERIIQGLTADGIEAELTQESVSDKSLEHTEGVVPVVVEAKTKKQAIATILERCADYDIAIPGSVYLA